MIRSHTPEWTLMKGGGGGMVSVMVLLSSGWGGCLCWGPVSRFLFACVFADALRILNILLSGLFYRS